MGSGTARSAGARRRLLRGVLTWSLLVAPQVLARCGDDPGDGQTVADARAQVASDCPCSAAVAHGDHVACAAAVASARMAAGLLRAECTGMVKRCAARSTCGRAGLVACCRTGSGGKTRCSLKRDATKCSARPGRNACVGTSPSCCDACGAGGCVAASTTTTPTSTTTTTSFVARPCGDISYIPTPFGQLPVCSVVDPCPDGGVCGVHRGPQGLMCACYPQGAAPCFFGTAQCGAGDCLEPGKACQGVRYYDGPGPPLGEICDCIDVNATCGRPADSCTIGICPGDSICEFDAAALRPCGCVP